MGADRATRRARTIARKTSEVALGVGVLLGVLAITAKAGTGDYPAAAVAMDGASGLLFLLAGVVAHRRRPSNHVGAIMVAVGIGWFAEDLQLSTVPVVSSVGLLFVAASSGPAVHLLLAFPTGRVTSLLQRGLVIAAYSVALGLVPLRTLFLDTGGSPRNGANLLLVHHAPDLVDAIDVVVDVAGTAIALGVLAVLVRRWWRAAPPERRVLAPVYGIGLVGAAASVAAGLLADPSLLRDATLGVYRIAFCLLPLGFLAGLLRVRLGRTAVATLLGELDRAPPPAELRALLARALGDPSLQVVYWRPDTRSWLDGDGHPRSLPADRAAVLVERDGQRVAALVHDPALTEDRHVLAAVAAAAGLALHNRRLAAEVRAQLVQVRDSRARIVAAADAERCRVERDLHDGAQQRLVTAALGLRLVEQRLAGDPATRRLVAETAETLQLALVELRELARGIHPALLTEAGLVPAMDALARRCPVPVELTAEDLPRVRGPVEATAYFVAAEALTNVVKHAHATAARIAVSHADGALLVQIDDDGVGGADVTGHGLLGLRDRVLAHDGELIVTSPPGGGTRVAARIPTAPIPLDPPR